MAGIFKLLKEQKARIERRMQHSKLEMMLEDMQE
jgi:hypothetical protein